MKNIKIRILILVITIAIVLFLIYCHNDLSKKEISITKIKKTSTKEKKSEYFLTIDIIPFEGISNGIVNNIYGGLKLICPNVILLNPIEYPNNAYFKPRNRYKADSLIDFLSSITPKQHIAIGLTNKDISTTKGGISDWGVMGLGFMPGNACVASTFRLDNNNIMDQFFKIVIHELGHTQGLDHCENIHCYMRDAEGKNHTNQETEFCLKCKRVLIKKGWNIK